MKLLNREEFLKLPEGTLYSEYDPHVFGDIRVKGVSGEGNNVYALDLIGLSSDGFNDFNEAANAFVETKQGDLDFDCYCRDNILEDQLFAVFEAKELSEMTKLLQTAMRLAINSEGQNAAT
jgi:hypothetical protein